MCGKATAGYIHVDFQTHIRSWINVARGSGR